MSSLFTIAKKLGQLRYELPKLAIKVIDDEDLDIVRKRLEQGEYDDGSSFPEYKPLTLSIKRETGGFVSQSGNIALKDTGGFHNSLKLDKRGDYAEMTSNDSVVGKLVTRFGDEIFDVSQDEATEMVIQKRDKLIEELEKFLQ